MSQNNSFKLEFIALMASLMSIVALSIDALLPALPEIGMHLNVLDPEHNQLLVTMIFLGIGFGQLILGPMSDSFGRKPIVYLGVLIFTIASVVCITTSHFEVMIIGRICQGIGLSAPRSLAISMIRDTYEGDYMAKIISIVVMFFILIPVIAPSLGQVILQAFSWQAIFTFNLIFALVVVLWFWKRQPETLPPQYRVPFNSRLFFDGFKAFFKFKDAVAFTLISGFITGSFMVYLSTAQQIFQEQYQLGALFPYIFASLAITIGLSTFMNSRLVERLGMWKIAFYGVTAYAIISLLYVLLFWSGNNPNIYVLITFLALQFFAVGLLFGNLRAIAMQPLGHMAGIGAAINGFISTVMAVPIANYIGSFVKTSVLPLFIGFTCFGVLSFIVFLILNYQQRQSKIS
jgi:DHA1 family bicyclomycin/chloramphenicol resistance-like MFS transporter